MRRLFIALRGIAGQWYRATRVGFFLLLVNLLIGTTIMAIISLLMRTIENPAIATISFLWVSLTVFLFLFTWLAAGWPADIVVDFLRKEIGEMLAIYVILEITVGTFFYFFPIWQGMGRFIMFVLVLSAFCLARILVGRTFHLWKYFMWGYGVLVLYTVFAILTAPTVETIRQAATPTGSLTIPTEWTTAFKAANPLWLVYAALVIAIGFVLQIVKFSKLGSLAIVSGVVLALVWGGYFCDRLDKMPSTATRPGAAVTATTSPAATTTSIRIGELAPGQRVSIFCKNPDEKTLPVAIRYREIDTDEPRWRRLNWPGTSAQSSVTNDESARLTVYILVPAGLTKEDFELKWS